MTKNKLLKALSLLLTVSMLVVSASFVSSALSSGDTGSNSAPETSDSGELGAPVLYGASEDGLETNGAPELADLEAKGGSVELDGTNDGTVTVSLVATKAITCFGIEGTWDTTEQEGGEYLALTELSFGDLTSDNLDYVYIESGEVMWTDLTFTAGTISADAKLLTATYKVAAGTPEGEYTVNFVSEVFTGEDGDPDETETTFTATITVKHHKPTVQAGQAATCDEDGWNAYYQCPICNKFYSDAEGTNEISDLNAWKVGNGKLPATDHAWGVPSYTDKDGDTHTANYVCDNDESHTKSETVDHDFTNGDCVCGKAAPVATGLKGDFDLNGDVDAEDLTMLARHVAGIEELTGEALANADVDGNGDIDAEDITVHARYVAGIIDEWPEN